MSRLLDLFCGAGGAARGYELAGFTEIVGVDVEPQPNYPYTFIQADVMEWSDWEGWDLIHASPPCQAYSTLRHAPGGVEYPDLIAHTRGLLLMAGLPYVIENVPGAPLNQPARLCGSSLRPVLAVDGDVFELRRHRLFETNWPLMSVPCRHRFTVLGVYGDLAARRRPSNRGIKAGRSDAQTLMGIDWMNDRELVEAIPPSYTEYIGAEFLRMSV